MNLLLNHHLGQDYYSLFHKLVPKIDHSFLANQVTIALSQFVLGAVLQLYHSIPEVH
jgi:hypothetical protein